MNTARTAAARSAGTDVITGDVVGHISTDDVVWVCDDPDIEFKIQPETWLMTQNPDGEVLEITANHFRPVKNRS